MSDTLITRDDVSVDLPRRHGIPFLLRLEVTRVSVAGRDYEIGTIDSRFLETGRTVVLCGSKTLLVQESADTEQAIAALLDMLNAQSR